MSPRGRPRGRDSSHLAESLNQNNVDFLIIDLAVALTFMEVADATGIDETRHRNHRNARKAYDTVARFLHKVRTDSEQQAEIDLRMETLRARLIAVGEHF
jgi:hypothetical protein